MNTSRDAKQMSPPTLRGLLQAVYVSDCICRGIPVSELVATFDGDAQLVDMWISFVKHNHWIEFDTDACRWSMTKKGQRYAYDLTREAIEYGTPSY